MLINYINNNHFNLLYSKNFNLDNICLFENLKDIKKGNNIEINFEGKKLNFDYIDSSYYSSENIYNELYIYLRSIKLNKDAIDRKKKQYPKMDYNQILSYFDIKYPERLDIKVKNYSKLRQRFRKIVKKFEINENGRLCIKNP